MNRQALWNLGTSAAMVILGFTTLMQQRETARLRQLLQDRLAEAAPLPRQTVGLPPESATLRNPRGPAAPLPPTADETASPRSARRFDGTAKHPLPASPKAKPESLQPSLKFQTQSPETSEMDTLFSGSDERETSSPAQLKGPRWNHAQATGDPDTPGGGDLPTAWAPRRPQSGEQWLMVGYDKEVEIQAINVHETYNPGALSKVAAILPDGTEKILWQGTAPGGETPVETTVSVPRGIYSSQIKLYVDTNRVQSWPEIDAVELVGTDRSRQWASSSSASSSYGEAQP